MDEDIVAEAQHELLLMIAWVLQNFSPEGVIRIPYSDLDALDCQTVRRVDDHHKQEIIFALINKPKPNLQVVED